MIEKFNPLAICLFALMFSCSSSTHSHLDVTRGEELSLDDHKYLTVRYNNRGTFTFLTPQIAISVVHCLNSVGTSAFLVGATAKSEVGLVNFVRASMIIWPKKC